MTDVLNAETSTFQDIGNILVGVENMFLNLEREAGWRPTLDEDEHYIYAVAL